MNVSQIGFEIMLFCNHYLEVSNTALMQNIVIKVSRTDKQRYFVLMDNFCHLIFKF